MRLNSELAFSLFADAASAVALYPLLQRLERGQLNYSELKLASEAVRDRAKSSQRFAWRSMAGKSAAHVQIEVGDFAWCGSVGRKHRGAAEDRLARLCHGWCPFLTLPPIPSMIGLER